MRVRTVRYPWPVLDAAFPRSLKRRARNIVLRERAGDTNTQDNYDQLAQPSRDPVHSRPPALAERQRPTARARYARRPTRTSRIRAPIRLREAGSRIRPLSTPLSVWTKDASWKALWPGPHALAKEQPPAVTLTAQPAANSAREAILAAAKMLADRHNLR
jgi:hypothetical protein